MSKILKICTVKMANICEGDDSNILRIPLEEPDHVNLFGFHSCQACADYLDFGHKKIPNSSVATIELIKLRAVIASQRIMLNQH